MIEAQNRVPRIAARSSTHRAFGWLHLQEPRIRNWQRDLVAIPAPPFAEQARAAWFLERFRELNLHEVEIDPEGNVLGWLRPTEPEEAVLLLSAHLDTVFAAGTPIHPVEEDRILRAPGACDNGAGLAALLAMIAAFRHAEISTATNILFAANVGEEAEGDLRGMRQIFLRSEFRHRILASVALEGAGTETVVTRALGSRRFRIEIAGPGGHAWTEAGKPNPITALAVAISQISSQPLPATPRTSLNIGRIEGGSSLTSIPQHASALVDIRSSDANEVLLQEVRLFRAVEDAVLAANNGVEHGRLQFRIMPVGDRPAGELPTHAPILNSLRAVDRHLRLRTGERIGSTDANLPIALGRNSIAIGGGGIAGGIHTTEEWYDSTGRELALRRILLLLLDLSSSEFQRQFRTESGAPEEGVREASAADTYR